MQHEDIVVPSPSKAMDPADGGTTSGASSDSNWSKKKPSKKGSDHPQMDGLEL